MNAALSRPGRKLRGAGGKAAGATAASTVVFLLDVDNTLLDNDRIVADRRSARLRCARSVQRVIRGGASISAFHNREGNVVSNECSRPIRVLLAATVCAPHA
jgi:hypothetical protein